MKNATLWLTAFFHVTSFCAAQQQVTFTEHIAPIVFRNCAPCHHRGTAAPFSLLTYQDVAKRAGMIEFVTHSRYMPPWKADPLYRSFANEKILRDEEITLIKQWVEQKMPKGAERKMPAIPVYTEGSVLRKPDRVMSVKKPFTIKGDGKENFVLFLIPFEFDKDHNVEAVEYVSTNYKSVHHANFGIYAVDPGVDLYGDTTSVINANDLMLHADRYAALTKNIVYYNGWVPGSSPIAFPRNVGFKMPRRGVIVLTNHYAPSSVKVSEQSSLNIFFSPDPVKREVQTLSIGSGGIGEIDPPLLILPNDNRTSGSGWRSRSRFPYSTYGRTCT